MITPVNVPRIGDQIRIIKNQITCLRRSYREKDVSSTEPRILFSMRCYQATIRWLELCREEQTKMRRRIRKYPGLVCKYCGKHGAECQCPVYEPG